MANQYITNARRQELTARLFDSADRICDCMDRITAGISTMKPIEFDRLMDEYRAEQVRYDRIERQLQEIEEPTKTEKYLERSRKRQQNKKLTY